MTKDELLLQIRKSEQHMQRPNITDAQREAAEERYCNLVALLGTMPDELETAITPEPVSTVCLPGVQDKIAAIWQILDPEVRRKRA